MFRHGLNGGVGDVGGMEAGRKPLLWGLLFAKVPVLSDTFIDALEDQ